MLLQPIDLTTALRPALLPDETLLFVQDSVGLYQGTLKIPAYQAGQVYLTSYRACYIDEEEPRAKAVAISLKDVDRCELYAGFLKSSPKVTLHPKAAKQFGLAQRAVQYGTTSSDVSSSSSRQGSPAPAKSANSTWICSICSFANPVPINFDPTSANDSTPLPPCLTCGIKPTLIDVCKGSIAGMSNRRTNTIVLTPLISSNKSQQPTNSSRGKLICPRCTFGNHPSMSTCEICQSSLVHTMPQEAISAEVDTQKVRAESPGPSFINPARIGDPNESIKFSFRNGGEKIFLDRLKSALIQRKWLLQSAPPAPTLGNGSQGRTTPPPTRNIGITGLERRDKELRKNNEVVIGNAFEDLSALMASAREIIALAEKFATQTRSNGSSPSLSGTNDQADPAALLSTLNLTTTKDMLGSSATNSTYLTQLSRQLADYLTDDTSGTAMLKSSGGIISLVDLWAIFNRARGGVELVSPNDFADAVALFEKLKLPVRMGTMRSGLKVVRGSEWSDDRIAKAITGRLRDMREAAIAIELANLNGDTVNPAAQWGRGVTALEVADQFGWSVGVASEELAMVEERGLLCREVGLEGVRFWENWFMHDMARGI